MSRKTLKRITSNNSNNSKKYVLGDVLGEGAFGQVREGMRIDDGKFGLRVAVKIISRRLIKKVRNGMENLKREMACIKKVKHKNVIQLLDSIFESENDKVYMIFELANLFSLQDVCEFLRTNPISDPITNESLNQLPIPYIKILFVQLIEGLQACHAKGVVHRDIKPSNLQLTSDGKLKIIDFGVAESLEMFSELDETAKFAGTPSFQPPEVAKGLRKFSATKADIWAAGVTLYYMVEGSAPFKGDTVDELYGKIAVGEFDMPTRADEDLKSLINGVLHKAPEDRFTLDLVFEHPWCDISSIDINLTEVLRHLEGHAKTREKNTKLMKRYMDEEADSDEEGGASTSTAGEDEDSSMPMDRCREQIIGSGQCGDLSAENPDELRKCNHDLQRKKLAKGDGCVIC